MTPMPLRANPRFHTAAVGGVLAIAVAVVEVLYRLPPIPSDHMNYFEFAAAFPGPHTIEAGVHQFMRYGLVFPIRIAQEIFGFTQAAYLTVPILAGVALAVGVYLLGVLLANRTVGVAAAVLTVGNSIVFPELTQPLPDLLAASIFCWAVVVTVAIRQRRHLLTATPRRETLALVAVGLLLGWSYLTREYIVFCWPLIPLLLARRVPLRRWLWIALPLAVAGGLEAMLNTALYDDPFARLSVAASHGSEPPPGWADFLNNSRGYYLTRGLAVLGATPEGGWLIGALVVTVLGAAVSRTLGILALWAGLFYILLVAFGGVIDPDQPSIRTLKSRYWLPLIPPIALGAVVATWLAVQELARRVPGLRARALAVASVAAVTIAAVPVGIAQHARMTDPVMRLDSAYAAEGGTQLEELRAWLAGQGGDVDTLWADSRSARLMPLFVTGPFGGEAWGGRTEVWRTPQEMPDGSTPAAPAPGDHVVLYSARSDVCHFCRRLAERLLGGRPAAAPPAWRLAFTTDDEVLQVYEVP